MQTEPEQWAVELLEAVHDASDMGSACGMVDCPQCKAAALTIQRAFKERERKLREALEEQIEEVTNAIAREFERDEKIKQLRDRISYLEGKIEGQALVLQALKETPDAQ